MFTLKKRHRSSDPVIAMQNVSRSSNSSKSNNNSRPESSSKSSSQKSRSISADPKIHNNPKVNKNVENLPPRPDVIIKNVKRSSKTASAKSSTKA